MSRIRLRALVSTLVLFIICVVAGYELKSHLWPDNTSAAALIGLQSYWPSTRRKAASDLAQHAAQADTVAPALVKALEDPDKTVRLNALVSLKAFGQSAETAGPALKQMLEHDPDENIRKGAASLLGSIRDQAVIPNLISALDDRDKSVRLEAIRALGRYGSSVNSAGVIDLLIAGLSSGESEEHRDASVLALESIAPEQQRVARAIAGVLAKDPSPIVRIHALALMTRRTFGFELEALIAALDDASPEVSLTAGEHLARIGLGDPRVIPALCHAALKADDMTREGVGINLERVALDTAQKDLRDDQLSQRYLDAVRQLGSVLANKEAAGRHQIMSVLTRIIASYQKSGQRALLEPSRGAVAAVLARLEDETDDVPLRLDCMNQFGILRTGPSDPSRGGAPQDKAAAAREDELHPVASWIVALGRMLKSQFVSIRARAAEILMESIQHAPTDPFYAEAWRKVVPILAETVRSPDPVTQNAAVTLLGMLGPEAISALDFLRSLVRESHDAAIRKSAESAIVSIDSLEALRSKDPAARVAAAIRLSHMDWRAKPGIPGLVDALKDPETKVKIAAAQALRELGAYSTAAVSPLLLALLPEPDATARAAFLEALEAIAPNEQAVLDAHRNAMPDQDSRVRAAAVSFRRVPADDFWVAALASALGDSGEEVRLEAGRSLTTILFEHPAVIPALVKALGDEVQSKAVRVALGEHLKKTTAAAEFGRISADLPKLQGTLGTVIPPLKDALAARNEGPVTEMFSLLGRIVAFARLSRVPELQKAIEPAVDTYLQGLNQSAPEACREVLARLDTIPIRRAEIISALFKHLERSDLTEDDRQTAFAAVSAQAAFVETTPGLLDALKPGLVVLTAALDSPEARIRYAATRALGYMGTEARNAENSLRRLARNDPHPTIRKDAEAALKAVNGIAAMPAPSKSGARM
jgi:HEAT repeat protein